MIKQRIEQLRNSMRAKKIDVYIIPTSDYHGSEYVGDYFLTRQFMSGFTGSAGTLVVTREKAGLWTDGRYHIQAAMELEGSSIELFKDGTAGTKSMEDYVLEEVPEYGVVALDGKVVTTRFGRNLEKKLCHKGASLRYEEDLIQDIWKDRPELSKQPAYILENKWAGESAVAKMERLQIELMQNKIDVHILTSLDDIAWLLNIRGNDVLHNPVVLSYFIMTTKNRYLFIQKQALNEMMQSYLQQLGVEIREYDEIFDYVEKECDNKNILIDDEKVNYSIYKALPETAKVICNVNPTTKMKAIKNQIEIKNLRNAHIKDGVAVTKFIYWLKNHVGVEKITEYSAAEYLQKLREEQEGFISPSFTTISAYKENAAMMHYSAECDNCAELKKEGMLLVDSGGQYFEGTTDITRTIVLGEISEEIKKHYTVVVKGMLNLSAAEFLHGCTGRNLDILARGPVWDIGLDYRCGTGHGVGYLLNVHEAPNGFRWRQVAERNDGCILEPGMVTTNEPGIYVEGSHGIRIENELVCQKKTENEYGQFLSFETITVAPIDLEAIDQRYLNSIDITRLNNYHKWVYDTLEKYMTDEERIWLKEATKPIG